MVYTKGDTTNANPFGTEERSTTDFALDFPPMEETFPFPMSSFSIPVGRGSGGRTGGSRRSANSHGQGHGAVLPPPTATTTSSWHEDLPWRPTTTSMEETDFSWRVETPTIASSSRSSYHPHASLPPMVDTSMESNEDDHWDDGGAGGNEDDPDPVHLSSSSPSSRAFNPKSFMHRAHRTVPTSSTTTTTPSVSLLLQERLSISFDGLSPEPSCRVMGRIYIQHPSPPSSTPRTAPASPKSYHLIIHDRKQWVEQWTVQSSNDACKEDFNALTSLRHMSLQSSDRLFKIDTSKIHSRPEPTAILEYQCSNRLKPIPMLIKTKLTATERGISLLGIRLRANPANRNNLERLAILVVVPPHVQPDDPPPQGGIWDDVKRTLSWGCDTLPPGQGMDLRITFHGAMDSTTDPTTSSNTTCPFPILVHCRGHRLFSRLNVSGETIDGRALHVEAQRGTTILYRKL